ncbi:MAG: pseudouridine synthase [Burkholderiaceae bacterium]|nr:pseudouridine synthase [Rhodoferax sp.]MCB2039539.1 pseudouridine synthase [Rhodoferax sp.]MCW5627571.1 pseudouridine synthase [Rhodoferax sp.]MCW5645085.1 pseudouridine synthase [Rhodoferax sp.]
MPHSAALRRPAGDHRPPTIDGVGPSHVGLPAGRWATYLDFLAERFPDQPRDEWARRMRAGKVLDDTGQAMDESRPYRGQGRLYYYRDCPAEPVHPVDVPVLYRDEHLLVVDKPHRMPVVPSGPYLQQSLLVRLRRAMGLDTLVPIHRIDRDTAGLVMFSLQPATRDAYCALFREHRIHKTYEAVAPWRAELTLALTRRSRIVRGAHFLQQCEQPGAPNAETRIELLRRLDMLALYRLRPLTGQRHQLRVHMAALGAAIAGDGIYPVLTPESHVAPALPLQLLARSIAFTDPLDGRPRAFSSQRTLALALPRATPL